MLAEILIIHALLLLQIVHAADCCKGKKVQNSEDDCDDKPLIEDSVLNRHLLLEDHSL